MNFIQNSYIVNIKYTETIVQYIHLRGVRLETMNTPDIVKVRPYDDSMWERYSIYDNMPYVWDADLNAMHIFTTVSGNLIKSYRCKILEPYEIKHK